MYRIKKRFTFEAAHILDSSYSKECQVLHGHSYKVDVYFIREDLNEDGMVEDFKLIKEVVNPIIDKFDHVRIMSKKQTRLKYSKEYLVMPNNPTAENMAKFIFEAIEVIEWSPEVHLDKVRIWETENNYAEYYVTSIPVTNECICCAK